MTTSDFDFKKIFNFTGFDSMFFGTKPPIFYEAIFTIYTGKEITQKFKLTDLECNLKSQFLSVMQQIGNISSPMKLKMEILKVQYSKDLEKEVNVIDYVEFKNKNMLQAEKESDF